MELHIKYNRTTIHIEGLTEQTTGGGEVRGSVVTYYAQSACAGLTRSGYNMAYGNIGFTSASDALTDARSKADATGRKLCKSCEKAALRMIEESDTEEHSCNARVMHDAIGYGCVKTGIHDVHETALELRWYDGKTRPFNCTARYCQDCEDHAAALVARH
jgi:hypothetical protein